MDFKKIKPQLLNLQKGRLLISEPFLNDPQFRRTVILLSDHNSEGSVGFIINRMLAITSNEIVPDILDYNFPLFYGGPVEKNTLHFIHKVGPLIKGSIEIAKGIFWSGDIEIVNELLNKKIVTPDEFRFFIGYSGWSPNQLEEEISEKAWWIADAKIDIIFDDDLENMWKRIVQTLGEDYSYMANSPDDPRWN
ncbi:MAG: YqgE/AlgH family protein [Bacteroidota bacterium]